LVFSDEQRRLLTLQCFENEEDDLLISTFRVLRFLAGEFRSNPDEDSRELRIAEGLEAEIEEELKRRGFDLDTL